MKVKQWIKTCKQKCRTWLRDFRMWQQKPYEVKPLSNEQHTCSTCGTQFTGNYCPRCGQSSIVGRFSFKKATLLFLDVWGLGNRGMFRSIRDLLFRPGYMIRDYLSGMQSAYFPPFKMFFLLAAFSLVVEHGLDLDLYGDREQTGNQQKKEQVENSTKEEKEAKSETNAKEVKSEMSKKEKIDDFENKYFKDKDGNYKPATIALVKFVLMLDSLNDKNPALFSLLTLILLTVPLFFFFRSSPNIPDLRYSEFIVALTYTSNCYSIYSIAGNLLDCGLLRFLAYLMVFVSLRQLSGFSKSRLFGYIVLTFVISVAVLLLLFGLWIYLIYLDM
ncbi:MAG: DUF3667 domain-containing protein [Prevotella sp.]|nr:DUF3667 domain-containing protein [Prevotella sp.]MBP3827883.1 DUF3667 domain-containing protein [Prevotella sp.]